MRTGVSSASGSSWGRGSSARSSARGGSCWAPPWTQLEHLQVPLLVPSPARSTQGRGDSGSPTHDAERPEGSPGHPFFYGWRNRGPDRKWAVPQWAGPPGTQQDSPECPMFTPGAWPWPPRSVSQSPSLRSPRSVRQPHLQRPVAGWHKPAGRASLGRVLMPRGLATVHGGRAPSRKEAAKGREEGKDGARGTMAEPWVTATAPEAQRCERARSPSRRGRTEPPCPHPSPVTRGHWWGTGLSRWPGEGVPEGGPSSGAAPHLCAP